APVQNIGAYGMELSDTFVYADVYDMESGTVTRMTKNACAFAYRESFFKHTPSLVIVRIGLHLKRRSAPKIQYADLARLHEAGEQLMTPLEIGAAVRKVRTLKFPDLCTHGTAGSFFKNPIITEAEYNELSVRYALYGSIPRYLVHTGGGVKIALAFVLDKILGLKGYREGRVSLFQKQPLVLVADTGATATEIDAFATMIAARVHDATGIQIEREVRTVN
ncbi:MAG: UDP-N-acetylenolpyruvoylglucosamine reductase, partial [Patescibacteria group bacterium]